MPSAASARASDCRLRPTGRRALDAVAAIVIATAAATSAAETPTGCGATPSPEEVLRRLNDARSAGAVCSRAAGKVLVAAPLQWNDRLAAAALFQAQEMARLARMQHRDSQNRGLAERLRALGYAVGAARENVAVGYDSFGAVLDAWLQSEGHCANLLDQAVVELGLACSDAPGDGRPGDSRYWTLVLGAPSKSAR